MDGELPNSKRPTTFVDQAVVPGDIILDLSSMSNQTLKLGEGLRQDCDTISVMKAGQLRFSKPNKYWVERSQKRDCDTISVMKAGQLRFSKPNKYWVERSQKRDCDTISVMKAGQLRFSKPNKYWVERSQKRYVPCAGDTVLGIVVDCKLDNFLVDIKGPMLAFLPVLAFEGGTRRNIPKFEIGTLLHLRVVKANNSMNPELACTDASGKASEFGPLKDGYMFETSTGLARISRGSWEEAVLRDSGWVKWPCLGECVLSTHRHSCRECNHELRDTERDTTKNYGGETH